MWIFCDRFRVFSRQKWMPSPSFKYMEELVGPCSRQGSSGIKRESVGKTTSLKWNSTRHGERFFQFYVLHIVRISRWISRDFSNGPCCFKVKLIRFSVCLRRLVSFLIGKLILIVSSGRKDWTWLQKWKIMCLTFFSSILGQGSKLGSAHFLQLLSKLTFESARTGKNIDEIQTANTFPICPYIFSSHRCPSWLKFKWKIYLKRAHLPSWHATQKLLDLAKILSP